MTTGPPIARASSRISLNAAGSSVVKTVPPLQGKKPGSRALEQDVKANTADERAWPI